VKFKEYWNFSVFIGSIMNDHVRKDQESSVAAIL